MAGLSEEAAKQIRDRAIYYRQEHYDGALRNFRTAIENAGRRIDREPERGLTSPRPYPDVVVADVRWIIEGRYWFAYAPDPEARDDPCHLSGYRQHPGSNLNVVIR